MIGMDPRAQEVFCKVSELAPDLREAELVRLCGGDAALLSEVRSLLDFHDQTAGETGFLDASGLRATLTELVGGRLKAGTVVGEYTIVDFVGAGGMGDVYAARQARPSRLVALKIVRPGLASERMLRMFSREAEILGLLSHPGIAQVFEAGVADYGLGPQPFLSMELVKGLGLLGFLDEHRPGVSTICELVARVCDAVQHAHQKGVIHRDLKPANIVITHSPDPSDSVGWQPKVLDFGIARTLDAGAGAHTTMHTAGGLLAGTLAYMSPEQVDGNAATLDTRTDVYSLGVILFRGLTGRMPRDIEGVSLPEAIRRISTATPPKLGEIDRSFKGDLEAIVATALEHDRNRRYQSASDLAADLRRFLAGRPILARQESAVSALSRRMTRYRHLIIAGAAAAVMLGSLSVFAFSKAKESARAAVVLADALRETESQREIARESAESLRGELRVADVRRARILASTGSMAAALTVMQERATPEADPLWKWAAREIVARGRCLASFGADDNIRAIALSPDGGFVSAALDGGRVQIFRPGDGVSVGVFNVQTATINAIAAIDNARFCVGGDDGVLRVLSFENGALVAEAPIGTRITGIDRSRGGYLAIAGNDADCLVDGDSLEVVRRYHIPGETSHCVRISEGLQTVAFGCRSGRVFVFDYGSAAPRLNYRPHTDTPLSVEFLENPPRIISGSAQKVMVVADLENGRIIDRRPLNNGNISTLRVNPEGTLLAAGGWWRVDILRTDTFETAMKSMATGTQNGGFSRDGVLFVTCQRNDARLWSMRALGEEVVIRHAGQASAVTTDASGRTIAGGWVDGTVIVRSGPGPVREQRWKVPGVVRGLALTRDGTRCLIACENGILYVGSVPTGELAELKGHRSRVACVEVDPSGRFAFTGSRDQSVRRWDLESMTEAGVTPADFGEVLGVRLAPDGETLAVIGRTRRLTLLRPDTLELKQNVESEFTLWDGGFSPDSTRFVAGSWAPSVEQFDMVAKTPLRSIRGHTQLVPDAKYSPDGTLFLTASLDRTLRIWDAKDGTELASFDTDAEAYYVTWTPEGFAACLGNGEVREWNMNALDRATDRTVLRGGSGGRPQR